MNYVHPHFLTLDNEWIRRALAQLFADLEVYLAKWARFVELKGE